MKSLERKKVCNKCNNEKLLTEFYYHKRRKKFMNSCMECNTKICCSYQKKKRQEKDVNFLLRARAAGIKRDKKGLNIPIMENLSNYLLELWDKQEGKCYYTNTNMDISGYAKNNHFAMTVDRIIPELGYVKDNIALCCSIVNRMKQDLTINELKEWCQKILDFKM